MYAECRHAECRYTECRHAECRGVFILALNFSRIPTLYTSVIPFIPFFLSFLSPSISFSFWKDKPPMTRQRHKHVRAAGIIKWLITYATEIKILNEARHSSKKLSNGGQIYEDLYKRNLKGVMER